jgi:hypothetical protein
MPDANMLMISLLYRDQEGAGQAEMKKAVMLLSVAAGIKLVEPDPQHLASVLADMLSTDGTVKTSLHANSTVQAGALREIAKAFQVGHMWVSMRYMGPGACCRTTTQSTLQHSSVQRWGVACYVNHHVCHPSFLRNSSNMVTGWSQFLKHGHRLVAACCHVITYIAHDCVVWKPASMSPPALAASCHDHLRCSWAEVWSSTSSWRWGCCALPHRWGMLRLRA